MSNMKFAAAVAEAGMHPAGQRMEGNRHLCQALELLRGCGKVTGDAYKEEFVYLVTLLERGRREMKRGGVSGRISRLCALSGCPVDFCGGQCYSLG